jgi:3-oxoacyl-[acyl-carrier protein] reductase
MTDRVVLVTGAASGVGAALCRRLAAPGVGLLAHTRRNAEGLARVAAEARAKGAEVETALGDLAEAETASALVDAAVARFGRLDVLVANAGFADRTPTEALTDVAFAASHGAIAFGFLRLARAAAPHLRASPSGRIVAVSSFVAHAFRPGLPTFPASAAAKAGVEALVRALAIELAPAGVTVNAVVPGYVRKEAGTHRTMDPAVFQAQVAHLPLGRLGEPDDIAAAIAFLASPDAAYITGQSLHVDGGLVMG